MGHRNLAYIFAPEALAIVVTEHRDANIGRVEGGFRAV